MNCVENDSQLISTDSGNIWLKNKRYSHINTSAVQINFRDFDIRYNYLLIVYIGAHRNLPPVLCELSMFRNLLRTGGMIPH